MRKILKTFRVEILIVAVYVILAIILTYPLFFKIGSSLYGYTSDNFSAAWYFWWLKYAQLHQLDPKFTDLVGAPYGSQYGALVLEDIWIKIATLLTFAFNELVALNLLFLISFPLAGLGTYFLTYYLWKDKLASFWAGLVFAFAPYHFWQGYSHLSLAFIYTLPIYLLALVYFDREKNYKAALLLASAFIIVFTTTFYYGFFVAILTVAYFLIKVVFGLVRREQYLDQKRFVLLVVSFFIVLLFSVPTLLNFYLSNYAPTSQAVSSTGTRSLNDFLSLSLRPWDLLLPAPDHPVLGTASENIYQWITKLSSDYKTKSAFLPERVVYVGFTPLLLLVIGLWIALRKKVERPQIVFWTTLLVVIVSFSLPPVVTIKSVAIYLPSYLLYLATPNLRAIVRLGVVILLLVSLVSSYSLAYLLKHIKTKAKQYLLVTGLSLMVIFEFLPLPPTKVTLFDNPPDFYQYVKKLPMEVTIAEYPMKFDMADALIWQRYHQKKIFNMFNGEYFQLWDYVGELKSPQNTDLLSALGVNYILFHTDYLYQAEHPFDELYYTRFAKPPTIQKIKGEEVDKREFDWLKLEAEFSGARLYKLRPSGAKVISYNSNRSQEWNFIP